MAVKKKAAAKKATAKKAVTKKVATKKAATKKRVAKKAVAKKAAPKAAPAKPKAIKDKLTKAGLIQKLADDTGLDKKDVAKVYAALSDTIAGSCMPRGIGAITLPGLVKIEMKVRPARKARMGRNPATGEPVKIPAKRATKVLKARVLAGLKNTCLGK